MEDLNKNVKSIKKNPANVGLSVEKLLVMLEDHKDSFAEKGFDLGEVKDEVGDFLSNNKDMIVSDMKVDFKEDEPVVELIVPASAESVFKALDKHRERWYHKQGDLDKSCLNVLAI